MALLDYDAWIAVIAEVLANQTTPGAGMGTTHAMILNNAGRYMTNQHAWKWRQRTVDADWTAGQAFVNLPAAVGQDPEIIHTEANSLTETFSWTTPEEMAALRGDAIVPVGFHTWGVLTLPDSTQTYRIEIYPTPASNKTGAISIWYRKGWNEYTVGVNGADTPDMPTFMETLLMEYVRAFALGYWDEQVRTNNSRLAEIASGPIFKMCKRSDSVSQPDYGPIINGAVQRTSGESIGYLPWSAAAVTTP